MPPGERPHDITHLKNSNYTYAIFKTNLAKKAVIAKVYCDDITEKVLHYGLKY